jgi:DNA polymerase-3 subunit delta
MVLDYEKLELNIKEGLQSMYLLYGEESYLISTLVKKIKKAFGELVTGINFVTLDGNSIDLLIQNIEMPAFGYDKKLIIVKDSGLFKKDGRKKSLTPIQEKVYDYLVNNFDIIQDQAIVVFIEDEADKNQIYEEIDKIGVICEVVSLKPMQIVPKLIKIANMYRVKLDTVTCNYLIEVCGTDMQNLMNEIRKLIEYAGENGTITKQDIDDLCIKNIESVIFDLTDNLGTKKIAKALEVYDGLIYNKEPVQRILITLYTHFKRLYLCSIAISLKENVSLALDLKPNQTFLVNKYQAQVRLFNQEQLKQILQSLIDLDYNFKSGNIDIDVGLRSILCNYCS